MKGHHQAEESISQAGLPARALSAYEAIDAVSPAESGNKLLLLRQWRQRCDAA
jgi:hypothetical protein